MARAPNEKALQAYELYKKGYKLVDIAKKMDVPASTVRRWKSTSSFNWETGEQTERSESVSERSGKKSERSDSSQIDNRIDDKAVVKEVSKILEDTELNDEQQLFCVYYVKYFNAKKAYQKVYGCNEFTAMTNGPRLLRKAHIKAVVEELKQNKLNQVMLEPADVFQWYLDIATADMKDYVTFGNEDIDVLTEAGERTITVSYVNFRNDHEVDGTLISEISKGKDGVKVKLADKMRAMDWITKHMDMATEEQRVKIAKMRSEIEQNNNSSTEVIDDWIMAVTGGEPEEMQNE